ncbi:MAG: hypothetical protein WBG86_03640, partial [Polyangiales bacterium]
DGPMVTVKEWTSIVEQAGGERIVAAPLAEPRLLDAFEIIKNAMAVEVNDEALYDETRDWFRFSKRAIREHGDGLSINTAGLTGFSAGTANMFLSARNFHKEKNRARYLETFGKTIDTSRGLLTLTSEENTMRAWIEAGRVYVRVQLAADAMGLRLHPVSQVLQEYPQMDALRVRFEALLGVEAPAKVQMLVRVGRSATPGLSPRRPLSDMMGTPTA